MDEHYFLKKYSGCRYKERIVSIGVFGEIKYLHALTIYDSNNDVIYCERHICS